MECPHCGWNVEGIAVESAETAVAAVFYGDEPGAWVREARELRLGVKTAALHHVCSNPQISDPDWWQPTSWWACKESDRVLDDDVKYDLNCADCARRHFQGRTN
jgi:hypothetical protein